MKKIIFFVSALIASCLFITSQALANARQACSATCGSSYYVCCGGGSQTLQWEKASQDDNWNQVCGAGFQGSTKCTSSTTIHGENALLPTTCIIAGCTGSGA